MARVYFSVERYGLEGVDQEHLDFVFKATNHLAQADPQDEVGVAIVGADRMKQLNWHYRKKDQPSSVLSFAYREVRDIGKLTTGEERAYLGDIYVCYEEVLRQARAEGETVKNIFTTLFVHGILHLLGFDHEEKRAGDKMGELENKILEVVLS